ncbi:hypothetical protein AAHA92_10190 [Salvia divinorum]|uniref:Transposase n=1 Tax=Salvia divinorum TaxID=28513 RepID=A0ABD1HXX0_SALDI
MTLIKKEDIKAWECLFNKPPENWSKSHFRDFPKCDILLNNHSESFNSYILEARDQPILTIVDRFKATYGYVINPLRDIDDYELSGYLSVQPLPVNPKKGRTQKRRRKTIDEWICKVANDGTKIVANTGQVKGNCSKCRGQGHNKRTCVRQISHGSVREEQREESVSTHARRSKLTVRRMASISQEHQNITSQLPSVEN